MEDSLRKYFELKGYRMVKRGRPGQHEPDWDAIDCHGIAFPIEEKRYAEISSNTSSWWSSWRKRLSNNYDGMSPQELHTNIRGWLAVIDGQLREWCELALSETGFLAVESKSSMLPNSKLTIEEEVIVALEYLQEGSRISGFATDAIDNDIADVCFVRIEY